MQNAHDPYQAKRRPAAALEPVRDPAGWSKAEMAASGKWLYQLSAAEIAEIRTAIAPFDRPDVDLMPLGRDDFPLSTFGPVLQDIRRELLYGRGFINIRGLPLEAIGKPGAAIAFWAVAMHLGDGVLSQNDRGHVLGHVTDLGQSKADPSQRGPYSSEEIPFHVDAGDIVGLLCMEMPISGGDSSLSSSVSVHNEMLKRRPDLVRVLTEPYYRDRRDEIPPGLAPWYKLAVFHYYQGYFSASLEPTYMGSAHRFNEVPEMTPAQREALDMVQAIAAEHRFDMGFKRGDMQFLNNHVIFHSRRGFQDHADPARKRHLMRVWIKALDGRPLPPAFYERHGEPAQVDRPGGIVGPDTVLNAPIARM